MRSGRLFAVAGPSGAGKDTLIGAAARARPDLHIVRRVITRPETPEGEPFEGVTEAEFDRRLAADEFALWWPAHGLRYGIPATLDTVLASGQDALFNASRRTLGMAKARYPALSVILVTASLETCAARLAARGRESEAQILERLRRADLSLPEGIAPQVIRNDGRLEDAVAQMLALLQPASA